MGMRKLELKKSLSLGRQTHSLFISVSTSLLSTRKMSVTLFLCVLYFISRSSHHLHLQIFAISSHHIVYLADFIFIQFEVSSLHLRIRRFGEIDGHHFNAFTCPKPRIPLCNWNLRTPAPRLQPSFVRLIAEWTH
ncbi:hypothetical protein LINGRAHAP2_LOCUS33082 [Linum grandiflorum]